MEKKILPALILTLFAGAAIADAKTDKSMSGASSDSSVSSDASAQDKSMSGAAASGSAGASSIDAARLNELSADPKVTLFLRLDTDANGRLSSQEISNGKDLLTLDVSGAGSGNNKGIDLISFKTALTNSMLGLGGTTMASSSTAGDRNIQGAGATGDKDGMLSDQVMEDVEAEGGPTMLLGGPNPSPDELTPEQKLNSPAAGSDNTNTQ